MTTTIKFDINNLVINAECMRDLAGSFYDIRLDSRNNMLVYLIPEATEKALEKEPEYFGLQNDPKMIHATYQGMITDGFKYLMEDPKTSEVVTAWINSEKSPKEFTNEEIAAICDVYYCSTVPAAIEIAAIEIIHEMGLSYVLHK